MRGSTPITSFIRLGVAAALLTFSLTGAAAPMYQLLVGSYTSEGNSEGIYRMQFDAENGQIAPQPLQVVRTHNPSWLLLDLNRNRLYAANENGPGHPDPVGRVSAFMIAPNSGKLSPLVAHLAEADALSAEDVAKIETMLKALKK